MKHKQRTNRPPEAGEVYVAIEGVDRDNNQVDVQDVVKLGLESICNHIHWRIQELDVPDEGIKRIEIGGAPKFKFSKG